MKIITASLPGVRIVRQDPWECLCSFIFSSNNNIKRIHKGLQEIRRRYGKYICTLSQTIPAVNGSDITWRISTHPITDSSDNNKDTSSLYYNLYEFPDISTLAKLSEEDFRALGMGYRAKYMYNSIATIQSQGGVSWLYSLRTNTSINGSDTDNDIKLNNRDHANYVQSELVKLNGIGKKVADCIALFSLDVNDAIPVDTHVRDIVCRDYARNITKSKSLTPQIYNEIGNIFRTIFDVNAGWAHSVLFTAELDPFIKFLPLSLQNEMKAFNIEQKQMLKDSKKITSKKISGSSTIIDMDDTNMEIGEDNGIEEVANEKRKHHTKESQIKSHANKRKKT
jgi:N-glycosylase/DNA lyase